MATQGGGRGDMGAGMRLMVAAVGLAVAASAGLLWSGKIRVAPSGVQAGLQAGTGASALPSAPSALPALDPGGVAGVLESDLAVVRAALPGATETDLPGLLRRQDQILRMLSRPEASVRETGVLREAIVEVLDTYGQPPDA
ncbi:MAG: hypothetical protein ACK4GW_14915, partial [Pseudorhodobacter sp.]